MWSHSGSQHSAPWGALLEDSLSYPCARQATCPTRDLVMNRTTHPLPPSLPSLLPDPLTYNCFSKCGRARTALASAGWGVASALPLFGISAFLNASLDANDEGCQYAAGSGCTRSLKMLVSQQPPLRTYLVTFQYVIASWSLGASGYRLRQHSCLGASQRPALEGSTRLVSHNSYTGTCCQWYFFPACPNVLTVLAP